MVPLVVTLCLEQFFGGHRGFFDPFKKYTLMERGRMISIIRYLNRVKISLLSVKNINYVTKSTFNCNMKREKLLWVAFLNINNAYLKILVFRTFTSSKGRLYDIPKENDFLEGGGLGFLYDIKRSKLRCVTVQ